jgi:hypothetical protein
MSGFSRRDQRVIVRTVRADGSAASLTVQILDILRSTPPRWWTVREVLTEMRRLDRITERTDSLMWTLNDVASRLHKMSARQDIERSAGRPRTILTRRIPTRYRATP